MINSKDERAPIATTSGSYAYGWQQLKKYFVYFLVISLIVGIADVPFSKAGEMEWENSPATYGLQLMAMAYAIFFLPVIKYGGDLLILRGIRNEELELGELFIGFKRNYINIVLAHLITIAVIIIGFIFLIIPGIVLACRLVFVSYLVMDKNMEPIAAIEKSWTMTRGHGWRIFGMALLAIPIFIVGLLFCIIGVVLSVMWVHAAFAALYYAIDRENEATLINDGGMPVS
ncbi:MAG: hypothetical protein HKN31_09935 [Pricia sp.]|nr:hypothetical protein [Pricia sp.]